MVEVKDVPRKPKQAVITDFFQRTTSRNSLGQTIPDSVGEESADVSGFLLLTNEKPAQDLPIV